MKRRQPDDAVEEPDGFRRVEIKPLGAGSEVGRSCIILKYM
jgi:hypothetical protein